MKTVRLYGRLATQFGAEHVFDIASPAEAVRALCANFPDFAPQVSQDHSVVYRVIADDTQVGPDEIAHPVSREVHIVPVVCGAGTSGEKLFVGGLLIVAGIGVNYFAPGFGTPLINVGIAFAVSGVAQMLTPVPKVPNDGPAERPDNKPSYFFGGPVNTVAQGQPVPIGYGRLIVGGAVISAGIVSEELA
jgi:predicted phage tail protein